MYYFILDNGFSSTNFNRNIVESGVKHHNNNSNPLTTMDVNDVKWLHPYIIGRRQLLSINGCKS
jgi:hypothetical protein